jgi:hypothetical protein
MKYVLPLDFHEAKDESLKLDNMIVHHIQKVLGLAKGKIHGPKGAAELLGVNPSTLRNRMNKLGIRYWRDSTRKGDQ